MVIGWAEHGLIGWAEHGLIGWDEHGVISRVEVRGWGKHEVDRESTDNLEEFWYRVLRSSARVKEIDGQQGRIQWDGAWRTCTVRGTVLTGISTESLNYYF